MSCHPALTASVTAAAIAISEGKTADELGLLAAVFTQLGDTIATLAAQKTLCEAKARQTKQIEDGKTIEGKIADGK